jgi:AraC family transcriptional regulator
LDRVANSSAARAVTIDPFFAIRDRWLRGYFEMLASEFDMYSWAVGSRESLLLSQTRAMLLQHLIRWHSDASRHAKRELDKQSRRNTIRPLTLNQIVAYVNDNLSQALRLEDLAKLAHLSESHFIESFRGSTGSTPYRYVTSTRLRASIELLRATELPIAEVAKSVGFSTSSHYTMLFRREYGITPKRYRDTCRTAVVESADNHG